MPPPEGRTCSVSRCVRVASTLPLSTPCVEASAMYLQPMRAHQLEGATGSQVRPRQAAMWSRRVRATQQTHVKVLNVSMMCWGTPWRRGMICRKGRQAHSPE